MADDEPILCQPRSRWPDLWFLCAVGGIVVAPWILYATSTRPADVLREVKVLQAEMVDLQKLTADRFYRAEAIELIEKNGLTPPENMKAEVK